MHPASISYADKVFLAACNAVDGHMGPIFTWVDFRKLGILLSLSDAVR